ELKVVWRAVLSQHYSIKAGVILEAAKDNEAEAIAVKSQKAVEVIASPGDSKNRSIHGNCLKLKEAAVAGGLSVVRVEVGEERSALTANSEIRADLNRRVVWRVCAGIKRHALWRISPGVHRIVRMDTFGSGTFGGFAHFRSISGERRNTPRQCENGSKNKLGDVVHSQAPFEQDSFLRERNVMLRRFGGNTH